MVRFVVLARGVVLSLCFISLPTFAIADVGIGKRRTPPDKVGSYRGMTAQGVRIDIGRPLLLDSIVVPVFAEEGDTAVVRVFGMERGGPAPVLEHDITASVVLRADTTGYQLLVARFEAPVKLSGSQAFVIIDRAPSSFGPVTFRDSIPTSCECDGEHYTQQVLRDSSGWKTAPLSFPWTLGVRVDTNAKTLRLTSDTIDVSGGLILGAERSKRERSAMTGRTFFLAVCDVNDDDKPDVITPGGVFVNRSGRIFDRVITSDEMADVGAICSYPDDMDPRVYLIAGGRERTGVDATHLGVTWVRTPFARVRFAALVFASNEPRIVVFGTNGDEQQVLLINPDDGRVMHTSTPQTLGIRDIRSMTSTIDQSQQGRVLVTGHDGQSLKTVEVRVDGETLSAAELIRHAASEETFDIEGPGLAMTSSSNDPIIHITSIRSTQTDDIDRRSSVVIADLDGDGLRELIEPTSDTCRGVVVFPLDSALRSVPYIDVSMLWGSLDLAIADLDGSGTQDVVGYVDGRTTILWNETPALSHAAVNVPRMYRGEEVIALVSGGTTIPIGSRGGLRGINVTTNEPFARVYGVTAGEVDSILTSRHHAFDGRHVLDGNNDGADPAEVAIHIALQPNPLSTTATLGLRGLQSGKTVTIEITDMSARRLRVWRQVALTSDLNLLWDGSDDQGRPIASGTYKVSVSCGVNVGSTNISILH